MNKAIKDKKLKSIMRAVEERSTHYDKFKDQIMTVEGQDTYETYFNNINKLIPSDLYTEDNKPEIMYDRRITLRNIFIQRAIFFVNQTLDFIKSSLENYGIICNVTANDIMKYDYRIFDLDAYDRYINNPVCAGDCALLVNSIIFNNVMSFRDLSCEQNGIDYKDLFEITNKILNIALLDLVHTFNLLYLEADEIYYPAGMLNESPVPAQISTEPTVEFLEGEERAKALKEIGREDLIETDIQVGRNVINE